MEDGTLLLSVETEKRVTDEIRMDPDAWAALAAFVRGTPELEDWVLAEQGVSG